MNVLNRYHPVPLFFYYLAVLLITAFSSHPFVHVFSFAGALFFLFLVCETKKVIRSLLFSSVLILVSALLNPLFSHDGVTALFFLQNNPVTLESILFGVNLGIRISAVLLICSSFDRVVTKDKIAYLLSRFSERFALLFSMTLRFIPLYLSEWKKLRETQTALGLGEGGGAYDRIRSRFAVFSAMLSRSLESAMETARTLRSRGYGLKKRTSCRPVRFEKKDAVFSIVSILAAEAWFVFLVNGSYSFVFYPRMTTLSPDLSLIPLAILFFQPFFFELTETLSWTYYRSKI